MFISVLQKKKALMLTFMTVCKVCLACIADSSACTVSYAPPSLGCSVCILCLLSTFLSVQLAIHGTAIELTSVDCLAQHSNLVFLQEPYNQLPSVLITMCLYPLVKYSGQTIAGKPLPLYSSEIYCIYLLQSLFTALCSCFWYS